MSVCVYSVCVVLCVGSGRTTGWSPVQGVLQTVHRIKKLKKKPGSKGCKAIERERKKERTNERTTKHSHVSIHRLNILTWNVRCAYLTDAEGCGLFPNRQISYSLLDVTKLNSVNIHIRKLQTFNLLFRPRMTASITVRPYVTLRHLGTA
jgi:hypothetical protein